MEHDVDAVVVGVGSGGTLTGLGRYLRRGRRRKTEMVLADPEGSVLAPLVQTGKMTEAGSWLVEGIGEDFVPPNCDLSLVSRGLHHQRRREHRRPPATLLRKEGILAGSSSGTLLAAALRYCREQTDAQARRHVRLRQRQQISLQDVQRLLDARAGPAGTRAAGRPARPDRPAPCRSGDGHRDVPEDTLLIAYKRMGSTTSRSCRCSTAASSSA